MKISIYQVLPRVFGNDNNTNKYGGTIEENGVGKMSRFTVEMLRNIKQLGITHIWYTGIIEHATTTVYDNISPDYPEIVKGRAGSPYAVKDYYDIDPDLAENPNNRMNEFEELVERTHKEGLKVIIDFIPNHLARRYENDLFTDQNYYMLDTDFVVPDGVSPYGSLFRMKREDIKYKESPAKATGNDCFCPNPSINDWYETVKLNYGVDYKTNTCHFDPLPDTWLKMRDILIYWTNKQIDGFRCDMAEMVPVEFWHWVIPQVKAVNPNIIFIAEVYNPDQYRNYIRNGHFDYLYDKVGLYDTLRAIVCNGMTTRLITHCWQQTEGINDKMLNFLENHDEQRIASRFFALNPMKALPAMMISATISRCPIMIYSGQEVGEPAEGASGFSGDDGRTSIFDYCSMPEINKWKNGELTHEQETLRNSYATILNLAISSIAIAEGGFYDLMWLNDNNPYINQIYVYIRHHHDEKLLIIANFASSAIKTSVNMSEHVFQTIGLKPDMMQDYFNSSIAVIGTDIDIQGYSYRVFKLL